MDKPTLFNEDYYLRGPQSGLSNYEDYRWLPEQTIPVCERIARYLGMLPFQSILDYGCARGYYVKAFNTMRFRATGYDISEWAIANCDETVRGLVSNELPRDRVSWVLCKDVLEHVPAITLPSVVHNLMELSEEGALLIVPLTSRHGGQYLNPADEKDATHLIRWNLPDWLTFIQRVIDTSNEPFVVNGTYKLPGVKAAADPYPCSCGFLTLKRQ